MLTDLKSLKREIKNYSKAVYAALSLFFFLANYHICWYFYPLDTEEHISNWWTMKVDIYCLVIAFCYLSLIRKKSTNKRIAFIEDFILSFGLGFAISNVVDRFFLDNRLFTWTSYYPLIIIAFVSYFSAKKLNKDFETFKNTSHK